jgi:hypothetical protein
MLGNQVSCEAGKGDQMTSTDCSKKGRRYRTTERCMVVLCKITFGLIEAEDAVGLMRRWWK